MTATEEKKNIGIDFGLNATVVAVDQKSSGEPFFVSFPGISDNFHEYGREIPIPLIASEIRYRSDGSFVIGKESDNYLSTDLPVSATVKRLRYYLLEESPVRIRTGDAREISYRQACSDFVLTVIQKVLGESDASGSKIMITRPLDSPPGYSQWIADLAESPGGWNVSSVDIACATARGYGLPFRVGEIYILIDFNPDTLDVAAVLPEPDIVEGSGCSSRVIGRATTEFGGIGPDAWIASHILSESGCYYSESKPGEMLDLMQECREARRRLSFDNETTVRIANPGGTANSYAVNWITLEQIYHKHDLYGILKNTISRALSAASADGYIRKEITAVMMTGELSTIPTVQQTVCRMFPGQQVRYDCALGAAARGATLEARLFEQDRIMNDYALDYRDPVTGDHRYRFLVRNGTRYPSPGQVAKIIISAAYDGQIYLGIPLCLIPRQTENGKETGIELIGDLAGGMRFAGPASDCRPKRKPVWVNEKDGILLVATPPGRKGEPRFELTFTIDPQRYLCVTARDLMTGILVKDSARMHKLE